MFKKNLFQVRKYHRLSLTEAAEKCGVSAYVWELWEGGYIEPDLSELVRIGNSFHISIDSLLKKDCFLLDIDSIKLLLLDVDGVMTDGGMYYSENGDFLKKYNAKDGLAIQRAKRANLEIGFISSSSYGNVIHKRAEILKVGLVHAGEGKKSEIVEQWLAERNLTYRNLAYIGDDLNDIVLIRKAGISACPLDACKQVREEATMILPLKGGEGCVRYFIEEVLNIPLESLGGK